MTALRRRDLDQATCQMPGCNHSAHDGLWLHSRCHTESSVKAEYRPKTGNLRITCAECGQVICDVAVAR